MAANFGRLLRSHRLCAGWTQEGLAERSGMSTHAISVLESGKRSPRLPSVALLADAFGLGREDRETFIAAARPDNAAVPPRSGAALRPHPAQLPTDLADFTGRAAHVRTLTAHLDGEAAGQAGGPAGGAVVLAAICGPGGIGKTSLAVHAAHLVRASFTDGQLYVNLHGTSSAAADPYEVMGRFLRDLGVAPDAVPGDAEERGALYRSTLDGRRVLILLDDAGDSAQVRPLLPGGGPSVVLVTSRSRLAGLDGVRRSNLEVLDDDEARTLFAAIVGPELVADAPDAVAQTLTLCGGLPLAIRIAAARLAAQPGWTVRTLADRLADQHRILDELSVEDRAVRTSFAVGYETLAPHAASAFTHLGVWRGQGFSAPAAQAILGLSAEDTQRALDDLVVVHLLQYESDDRYTFHDLVRVYAAERAEATLSAAERREAVGRLSRWYLGALTAATLKLEPGLRRPEPLSEQIADQLAAVLPDLQSALTWCDQERSNVAAVAAQAAASGYDQGAWKIPVTAQTYYHRGCHWNDWEQTHGTALAASRRLGDRFAEGWVLHNLGILRMRTQDLEQSMDLYRQAQVLREEVGDRIGLATSTSNLGNCHLMFAHYRGESAALDSAVACFESAVAIFREVDYEQGVSTTLTNLGATYYDLGRHDEAADRLLAALELNRRIGNQTSEATALHSLGNIAVVRGEPAKARSFLEQAIEVRRTIGDRFGEAVVLEKLADVDAAEGAEAAAALKLDQAADLLADIDPGQSTEFRTRAAKLR